MQDGDLIRKAAAGDRRAFDELVRRKRELVLRVAFQVTGDREDALDVAQGVFLRLWQRLGRFDTRRRFDTWLYRITVNAAIDMLRSRGARGLAQPLPDELPDPPEARRQPEERLDLAALQRAFERLAGELAPKQRTAFVLREIEGLTTAEVAQVMDIAESTVRNHLLQARRTLQRGLRRDYPGLCPPGGGQTGGGEDP